MLCCEWNLTSAADSTATGELKTFLFRHFSSVFSLFPLLHCTVDDAYHTWPHVTSENTRLTLQNQYFFGEMAESQIVLLLSRAVRTAPGALICLRWLFIFSKFPSQRCRIYPGRRTLWFMVAGVENYADTVWHCKSTASSPLPLSSVFKMRFSRVPSAPSPLHEEEEEKKRMLSRDNVTFTFHLTILSVFFFSLGGFFSTSSNPHTPLRLFCRPLKAESRHALWFDLLVFTPLPPLS